jgi:hypothetical protein
MLLPPHHNGGRNHSINIANRSYENVIRFKDLRTTLMYQKWIHGKN